MHIAQLLLVASRTRAFVSLCMDMHTQPLAQASTAMTCQCHCRPCRYRHQRDPVVSVITPCVSATTCLRGWRNTVGDLIETLWLKHITLSRALLYWYVRETQRGTVSSNSRFQPVLCQQCSANLLMTICSLSASPQESELHK